MLSCSEVTRLWATDEISTAPFRQRVSVRLHLLMCRFCRRYVRELATIGAAARRMASRGTETEDSGSDLMRRLIEKVQRGSADPGQ